METRLARHKGNSIVCLLVPLQVVKVQSDAVLVGMQVGPTCTTLNLPRCHTHLHESAALIANMVPRATTTQAARWQINMLGHLSQLCQEEYTDINFLTALATAQGSVYCLLLYIRIA